MLYAIINLFADIDRSQPSQATMHIFIVAAAIVGIIMGIFGKRD